MIPDETIQRIRNETDIVDVISQSVELKKNGNGFSGRCPFHKEKTGSFSVSLERKSFHCFGCGAHGDVIDFVSKHRGIDFKEAVELLASRSNIFIADDGLPPPKKKDRPISLSNYQIDGDTSQSSLPPEPKAKRPIDDGGPPAPVKFDWDACVEAFGESDAKKVAEWRGYSIEFVKWMNAEKLIGLHRGNVAFPVHEGSLVTCCQYKLGDKKAWAYHPKGRDSTAMQIGNPLTATHTIIGESQWDVLAVLERLKHHEDPSIYAGIATRGALNNTDISGVKIKSAIAIPQNDPAEKKNTTTGRTPAEEWLFRMEPTKNPATRFSIAAIPGEHEDANDWIRAANPSYQDVFERIIHSARNPFLDNVKTVSQIISYDTRDDVKAMIGYESRYLSRGGSLLFIGPSGIGKSTLMMGLAIHAAGGIPWHGIKFRRAMKTLVVQAENDEGDLSEMVNGVFSSRRTSEPLIKSELTAIKENLQFINETELTGRAWCEWLEKMITETESEIVFVDPLLSYVGDDITQQKVASQFLRNWLQPIMKRTGAIIVVVHHTGKPVQGQKGPRSDSDLSYLGIGSSELVNWARAVAVILPTSDNEIFKLVLSKRGKRAQMVDFFTKQHTSSVHIRHGGERGLSWVQTQYEEPEPEAKTYKGKSKPAGPKFDSVTFLQYIKPGMDWRDCLNAITAGDDRVSAASARDIVRDLFEKKLIVSRGGKYSVAAPTETGEEEEEDTLPF